jgi:flavin-binding protein dodecin
MAKQPAVENSVYKVIEAIGTSTQSWEDAAKNAAETAGRTLRDLRVADIVETDITVKDGKVQAYRVRVLLSFNYES